MYWQVDGHRLNLMDNNQQDYPHKESLVDLSGWSWKASGAYTITFVAKDNQGTTIAEKSVLINVIR